MLGKPRLKTVVPLKLTKCYTRLDFNKADYSILVGLSRHTRKLLLNCFFVRGYTHRLRIRVLVKVRPVTYEYTRGC